VRLDNATDRKYVGSVIVNEANKRFFEPALPRNWMAAITGRYRF
jgi:iron complex outermembrane receptor protein